MSCYLHVYPKEHKYCLKESKKGPNISTASMKTTLYIFCTLHSHIIREPHGRYYLSPN